LILFEVSDIIGFIAYLNGEKTVLKKPASNDVGFLFLLS